MYKVIIPVLLVILAVVGVSGCVIGTPANNTYSANGITFDYPANWTELDDSYVEEDIGNNTDAIFSLGNDTARLSFGKVVLKDGNVLNTLPGWTTAMRTTAAIFGYDFLSEKSLTVAAEDAYQVRFKTDEDLPYYTAIYFIKDDDGYIMVYQSDNEDIDTLDAILNNFTMS